MHCARLITPKNVKQLAGLGAATAVQRHAFLGGILCALGTCDKPHTTAKLPLFVRTYRQTSGMLCLTRSDLLLLLLIFGHISGLVRGKRCDVKHVDHQFGSLFWCGRVILMQNCRHPVLIAKCNPSRWCFLSGHFCVRNERQQPRPVFRRSGRNPPH